MAKKNLIKLETQVAGKFLVRKERNGRVISEWEFDNLITDYGLNLMGRPDPFTKNTFNATSDDNRFAREFLNRITFGTGTTPPEPTDTHLELEIQGTAIAYTSNKDFGENISHGLGAIDPNGLRGERGYYIWTRTEWHLEAGAGPFEFHEVGVGKNDAFTGHALWSRQLFKDEDGNVSPLVKEVEDDVFIAYELRVYPAVELATIGESFEIAGHTYKTRWFPWINNWGFDIIYPQSQSTTTNQQTGTRPPTMPTTYYFAGHNIDEFLAVPDDAVLQNMAVCTHRNWRPYEEGSREREMNLRWNRDSFNAGDVFGLAVPGIFSKAAAGPQWAVVFLPESEGAPVSLTKDDTQQMMFTITHRWRRKEDSPANGDPEEDSPANGDPD